MGHRCDELSTSLLYLLRSCARAWSLQIISLSIPQYCHSSFSSVFPSSYMPPHFLEERFLQGHLIMLHVHIISASFFLTVVRKYSWGRGRGSMSCWILLLLVCWCCGQGMRCPGSCDSVTFPVHASIQPFLSLQIDWENYRFCTNP